MRDLLAKCLVVTAKSLLLFLFAYAILGLIIYFTADYGVQ